VLQQILEKRKANSFADDTIYQHAMGLIGEPCKVDANSDKSSSKPMNG
jgi:hypothetical protein